jgi:hypothetical protein
MYFRVYAALEEKLSSSGLKAYTFENKVTAWNGHAATTPPAMMTVKRSKPILLLFILSILSAPIIYVTLILKSADSGLIGLKSIPYAVTSIV